MKITIQRQVDESSPDESFGYRYSYDVYRFTEDAATVVVWSYVDQPHNALLHHLEFDGTESPVCDAYLRMPLVREAVGHLLSNGKTVVTWDGPRGIEAIPENA